MKYLLTISLVLMLSIAVYADETKIGYVDSQRIFTEFPAYQEAQVKFNNEVETWNREGEEMKNEIDQLTTELEGQSLILSAEKKSEKEDFLAAKQDTLNQFLNAVFGPEGRAEQRMAELSKPVRDKILATIEQMAIENDYSIVFDAGAVNIAYAKKSLDITDDVLAELAAEE